MMRKFIWIFAVLLSMGVHAFASYIYLSNTKDGEAKQDNQGVYNNEIAIEIFADNGSGVTGEQSDQKIGEQTKSKVSKTPITQEIQAVNSLFQDPIKTAKTQHTHSQSQTLKTDSRPSTKALNPLKSHQSPLETSPIKGLTPKIQRPDHNSDMDITKQQLSALTPEAEEQTQSNKAHINTTETLSPLLNSLPKPRPKDLKTLPKPQVKKTAKSASPPQGNSKKNTKKGSVGKSQKASGGAQKGLKTSYALKVRRILERHKQYPRAARSRGQSGVGKLSITIDKSGRLVGAHVRQGTGHKLLDKELVQLAKRAAPYPKIPEEISNHQLTFTIPIRFGQ